MPKLIEDIRLAAHTAQLGKSKEQCIAEFKARVPVLYENFHVALPDIYSTPSPQGSTAGEPGLASGASALEAIVTGDESSESLPDGSEYYSATESPPQPGYMQVPARIEETETRSKSNGKIQGYVPNDVVEVTRENLEGPMVMVSSERSQTEDLKLFSKEWWLSPSQGIAVIGGAVGAAGLIGGVVWLLKKWHEGRDRNREKGRKVQKRWLHARSWEVVTPHRHTSVPHLENYQG
jgi:hypothetical protein